MYFTYVIQSIEHRKIYIGQTNNLEDRLKRHNAGGNKFTKPFAPYRLIAGIILETRKEAVALEKHLKRFKNHISLDKYLNDHYIEYLKKEMI